MTKPKDKAKKGGQNAAKTPTPQAQELTSTGTSTDGDTSIDEGSLKATDPDILEKLCKKIDNLSTEVHAGFEGVKKEINELKELKQTVEEVKSTANTAKKKADGNAKAIQSLRSDLATALNDIKTLQASYSQMKQDHLSLDSYTRRDNLRFHNIPEEQGEDCEKLIRDFMINKLEMPAVKVKAMKIVRCHRLRSGPENSKPIICRFHFFGDRQEVWGQRSKLKGTSVVMQEDFPPEITSQRNLLAPIMFEARRQGKRANMVANKLYIDNSMYTTESLDQLPDCLDPSKLGTKKINEYTTAFFGALSPLSNFHKAPFKDKHHMKYEHTEQYLQYHKALVFKDEVLAAKILAAKNPADCKFLGKKVKSFDPTVWESKCRNIMKEGLTYKFTQNRHCLTALKATGETTLAEASRFDRYWGIGMAVTDKDVGNSTLWGENMMGELLEEVRDELEIL